MRVVQKRKNLDQKHTAYAKATAIKTSAQKLGLVANLIKGMTIEEAFLQLQFNKKRVAKEVSQLLNSAVANAENNHNLDIDKLYIAEILIGKSFALKRFHARAKGSGAKILKPFCNMTIFVSERRG
jgi:large subunit ribosomal protein L22